MTEQVEFAGIGKTDEGLRNKCRTLLTEFLAKNSDVSGQMILLYPAGVPLATTWQGTVDPILVGAVCAAVKITFQHLCEGLKKGNLERLFVNSENGKIIIQNAGPKAILVTIMSFDVDFNRIGFLTADLSKKIHNILHD